MVLPLALPRRLLVPFHPILLAPASHADKAASSRAHACSLLHRLRLPSGSPERTLTRS